MATAVAKTTDARARSLELAEAHGHTSCSHAAKTLGWTLDERTGALVSLVLEISSATSDAVYAVGYLAGSDDASCDCPAGAHHRPCWHRGLAILKGRSVARLYTLAGRAEAARAYRADLAAEDNARVLGYH